jgi:hypothetical protein
VLNLILLWFWVVLVVLVVGCGCVIYNTDRVRGVLGLSVDRGRGK